MVAVGQRPRAGRDHCITDPIEPSSTLLGIVLYVAIDVALGFLRPDYSLVKNYESDYGRGAFAWLMDLNFVLRGVLSGLTALELRRAGVANRWTFALIWVWAGASALLALFPDNRPATRVKPAAVVGVVALVLVVHSFGLPGLFERAFLVAELAWLVVALQAATRHR